MPCTPTTTNTPPTPHPTPPHLTPQDDALGLGLAAKLAKLAAHCRGVVVSRSSPSQKAAIVRLMTTYEMDKVGWWQAPTMRCG